jgi:hypothetical protein
MAARRPSLPIGFIFNGLPTIERALTADDAVEIYLLTSQPGVTELLVIYRGDPTPVLTWWAAHTEAGLNLRGIVDVKDIPGFSAGAHLAVKGEPLQTANYSSSNAETLEALLFDLAEAVFSVKAQGLLADLNPNYCWRTIDGNIQSILPTAEPAVSERDAIRYLARSFFRIVTGIAFDSATPNIPALSQWCRGAGGKLSGAIAACLTFDRNARTITTLAQLKSEFGMSNVPGDAPWEGIEPATQGSHLGSGLGKVAGMHRLKELLRAEVVEPVRNPARFQEYGLSIPNGILLYGPPGCGKTYIARALAEELGHYFSEIIPSELASPYVHGSVIRIRELFDEAAERAPAVIFIDEFEALVPVRSDLGGFQHHKAEEVNELLTHLNTSSDKKIFIIAATNQPELIDPAVRRTGRLDKLIYVGPPDEEARHDMLLLHLSNRPVSSELNVDGLAAKLSGYSASDLKFLVDEAARDALARKSPISQESFQGAMTKIAPSIPADVELQYQSVAQRGY